MKIKFFLVTSLAVTQASKLFGISKNKLDVKAGFVEAIKLISI